MKFSKTAFCTLSCFRELTPGKSGGLSHFEYQAGLEILVLISQTDIDMHRLTYQDARGSSIFHCQSQACRTKECPTRGLQDGDTTLMLRWKGGANWGHPATVSGERCKHVSVNLEVSLCEGSGAKHQPRRIPEIVDASDFASLFASQCIAILL